MSDVREAGDISKKKPGRKPLPPGQGKDERLQIRVSASDKAALQAKADAACMSLSAWLVKVGLSARK